MSSNENITLTATLKGHIDGEIVTFEDAKEAGDGVLTVDAGHREWYLAEDSDKAGELAAERWRDMAKNDPKEFACIIGTERLVQWAMGQNDSYGISSLDEFCEVTAKHPEEELASYDGNEWDIEYDASDYEDEAREALAAEREIEEDEVPEEDVKTRAEELLAVARKDFEAEHGFIPTVAYRHN